MLDMVYRSLIKLYRYLTQVTDQIMALISHEHAASLVWDKEQDEQEDDQGNHTRLFTFKVSKTKEQEEDIKYRPGFQVRSCVRVASGVIC
jgi:hypothetical protein